MSIPQISYFPKFKMAVIKLFIGDLLCNLGIELEKEADN